MWRLVRRCFFLAPLFLAGISSQLSVASESGYLQTVGPPRLRFTPPAVRPEVDPLLEINLAITAPTPTNTEPERAGNLDVATVVVTNVPSIEPAPTTNAATSAPAETSTATSGSPQPGSNIQGVMPQPQLFLQYFTPEYLPGTNGFGFGFGLPVSFFPPQPWRTASSSATYQTIPPEKP